MAEETGTESTATGGGGTATATTDTTGFPANTPLEQMNVEQRAAYWQHYARQHEGRYKDLATATKGLTAAQIAERFDKADKHDAIELELGSTADKAAAKAAQEATEKTLGELQPELIQARLDAAAGRAGVSEEDLTAALQFVDTAKFLGTDGKVDTDKVKAFIATIKPASNGGGAARRTGPSSSGQGHHQAAAGKPGDAAKAALAKRGIKVD